MKLPSIQSLLKKYDIKPKRRLGQNFLVAQPTMKKIVDALGAESGDVVLEIGCGMGIMTAMLAERCSKVYAVDADRGAIEVARMEFGDLDNVEWIQADILKFDPTSLKQSGRLLVIGNIPYNISSPILFHLLDYREHISCAILMMQKEVADRVTAKPGGKDYGALSVMLQSYAECKKLFNVARTNFLPPPKVMSSVVEFDFTSSLLRKQNGTAFGMTSLQKIVQAAFQMRRKTIRNALIQAKGLGLKADDVDLVLDELKIDPMRRPETLSVDEFHRITLVVRAKLI